MCLTSYILRDENVKFLIAMSLSVLSISNVIAARFEPATVFNIFVPKFTTIVQYDDNIYTSEFETVSSFIYYLSPSVEFAIEDGLNRYGGEYILTSSIYSDNQGENDNDDMTDHEFSLFAYNEFTSKHRTTLNFGYDNFHEKRGSSLKAEQPLFFPVPLDYDQLITRFHYQFGGRHAKMRIGAGLSYYEKEYNSFTQITKYRDFDGLTFSADSDYQIGDVTYLTFNLFTTDINYKHRRDSDFVKDNQDSRALVGLTWRGASTINGRARLGYQYKTFDEGERSNFNGNTVDFMINWSPKQRAIYSVTLSRVAEDSDTVGDYINNLTGAFGWSHQWTDKFDSNIQFRYSNQDYIGAVRKDKITNINTDLIYSFSRWLNLSAGYEHSDSSSNVANIGYEQNIFTLSLKVGF